MQDTITRRLKPINDVKRALEICAKKTNCDRCPYNKDDYCYKNLCNDTLVYLKLIDTNIEFLVKFIEPKQTAELQNKKNIAQAK